MISRSASRSLLPAVPCLLLAPALVALVAQPTKPAPPAAKAKAEAKAFTVEVTKFDLKPADPFRAEEGADFILNIEAVNRNAPPDVQWFFSRRVVETHDGKTKILWQERPSNVDNDIDTDSLFPLSGGQGWADGQWEEDHRFSLRDLPVFKGEIAYEWDALIQPTARPAQDQDVEELLDKTKISKAEMDKLAPKGGVRLARRVVLVRAGEKVLKPVFAAKPALRVLGATMQTLAKNEETVMTEHDTKIVLRLAYEGGQAEPSITTTPEGIVVFYQNSEQIGTNTWTSTAVREGKTKNYRLEGTFKRAELKGARKLRVEARVSDGKSWPATFKASIAVGPAKK